MEPSGFLRHPVQSATFAMQSAACARKCQRERHISNDIWNLKNEITEPDADSLIA
jgi:hypothetical protein